MGRGLVKSDLREKTHLLDGAKLWGVTGKGRTLTGEELAFLAHVH